MKTSLIAFSAILSLVSAQNAIVHNHCATTVYIQSFPYDGSAPGPLTAVPQGGTFSETFRASGSVRYFVILVFATPYKKWKLTGNDMYRPSRSPRQRR